MKNILRNKSKILIGVAVLALLAFTFWWGGSSPSLRGWNVNKAEPQKQAFEVKDESAQPQGEQTEQEVKEDKPENQEPEQIEAKTVFSEEKEKKSKDEVLRCTLSVRCDEILENLDRLKEEKLDIIPRDGIIFGEKEVEFYQGESVFNITLREMKKNKIQFEFVNTPGYDSAYVEGIANIYEFDCKELSGWLYKVNGVVPEYGCSKYILKPGDKVEWLYSCDLGEKTDI